MACISDFLPGGYEVLDPAVFVRCKRQHCINSWAICIVFIIAISGASLTTTLSSITATATSISCSAIGVSIRDLVSVGLEHCWSSIASVQEIESDPCAAITEVIGETRNSEGSVGVILSKRQAHIGVQHHFVTTIAYSSIKTSPLSSATSCHRRWLPALGNYGVVIIVVEYSLIG